MNNRPRDPTNNDASLGRALTLDVDKYQKLLDAPELSFEEREEYIRCLWGFLVTVVKLGFELQEAPKCGKDQTSDTLGGFAESDLISLPSSKLASEFALLTGASASESGE